MDPVHGGLLIVIALIIYAIFYYTHGRYLQNKVVKADPNKPTPAQTLYDGVDYVPANKYVLYGHHFASIAGAGPIVGPAIALGWGWLPAILWVWFGNVFVGVVHDYLSLMASVRYDGRSIGWVAGELMGRKTMYIFNSYIWFTLLLIVAAFGFVISALFSGVPGAGLSALVLLFLAVITGYLMYKTRLGVKGSSPIAWAFIIFAVFIGIISQEAGWFDYIWPLQYFKMFNTWLFILLVYIIIAASIPVWVLLQPRDYMNAYILWASLAIGGGALVWLLIQGGPGNLVFPSYTMFSANIVGGKASPFWPTVPLIIACGALSGFHSLVGSGTSSKQLANELHGLTVAYAGMETEGFLSTMVIASIAAFGLLAFAGTIYSAVSSGNTDVTNIVNSIASDLGMKPVTADNITEDYAQTLVNKFAQTPSVFGKYYATLAGKLKWVIIPKSYAYVANKAFGLSLTAMTIFGTLWITGFALTTLDTATRLGRYAWQELLSPLKKSAPGAYKAIANKWVASGIIAVLGMWLAASKQFLILWPAFAGMNQLLASLALMTVAVWTAKIQKASGLGKALTVVPAVFLWITVTIALLWFEFVVMYPQIIAGSLVGIAVGTITAIGIILNLLIFALWIRSMKKP